MLVSWTAIVVTAPVLGSGKTAAERERLLRVCPIVACNAAVLAVALGNAAVAETLTWDAALGASVGAGLGVLLAVVLFAFVRSRIDERLVPAALRGLPITLVTASLMALAFTGVAGIASAPARPLPSASACCACARSWPATPPCWQWRSATPPWPRP